MMGSGMPPLSSTVIRSVIIACIVCPVLTLINQWEQVTALSGINPTKVALTFIVPFVVSLVSALLARRQFDGIVLQADEQLLTANRRADAAESSLEVEREAFDEKLEAARNLELSVVMIDRPVVPPRETFDRLEDILSWLDHPARLGV